MKELWSAQDTTPADIEAALRGLLEKQHAENQAYAPARVVNLVAVVDRASRDEVVERLEGVGRFHPSRTLLCTVEEHRTTLDARASMSTAAPPEPGSIAVTQERVEIDLGPRHLARLDSIVDALIVPDLTTVVWAPHGHAEAVDAMRGLADVVLLDSGGEPELDGVVRRVCSLSEHVYVVDLAWLRGTPWRERIAATFDPPEWRPALREISGVTVRHREDSTVSGVLLLGWLASRLGWKPEPLGAHDGRRVASARAGTREVSLELEPVPDLEAPGLAGVTVEAASGAALSLDRGAGGLSAKRRTSDGRESSWVVLGASRGEAGILGEGIRQALLRDPTYRPAVEAAGELLS